MPLLSRNKEVTILEDFYQTKEAGFLALYGRRRVGKTFLIRSLFDQREDSLFFNVTGAKDAPMQEQITHVTSEIGRVFYGGISLKEGSNWDETFDQLTKAIDHTASDKKVVLFFDELPWMATRRSRLLETLDYYWNQHWSRNDRIRLIVCGSSASWIINNIIHNHGGLHNRITQEMHLEPFDLSQTKHFLDARGIRLGHMHILQLYMLTGGVPFYLTKVKKGLSATQIIESLAFRKGGFFLEEFDKLFASLFNNSEAYVALVRLLAQHREGIDQHQLLRQLGDNFMGGQGQKMLENLEQTGFILRLRPLYNTKRGTYYRLIDEYALFYLKWIEPVKDTLSLNALEKQYWQNLQKTPEWYSWQGYAFENICYKHLIPIRNALQLNPMDTPGTWRFVPTANSNTRGGQIDLLFDRKDDAITICEIKCTQKPFTITKDYLQTILQKIEVFKERTGSQKQCFVAFISANGIKNNFYAEEVVQQIVTLDDLFR